jgi:hypothetical protein
MNLSFPLFYVAFVSVLKKEEGKENKGKLLVSRIANLAYPFDAKVNNISYLQ